MRNPLDLEDKPSINLLLEALWFRSLPQNPEYNAV